MDIIKNGEAFLCTKTVFYTTGSPTKVGKVSFTQGKLYYVSQGCYLIDDNKITKNYEWVKGSFSRSPENDIVPVKKNNKPKVKK